MCWLSTNLNCTWYPIFTDVDWCILMIKQPSADINPANQQWSIIKSGDKVKSDISSSFAGRMSGKAVLIH